MGRAWEIEVAEAAAWKNKSGSVTQLMAACLMNIEQDWNTPHYARVQEAL